MSFFKRNKSLITEISTRCSENLMAYGTKEQTPQPDIGLGPQGPAHHGSKCFVKGQMVNTSICNQTGPHATHLCHRSWRADIGRTQRRQRAVFRYNFTIEISCDFHVSQNILLLF